jgi:hypothetical protein
MSQTIAPLKGLVAATFTPLREDRSLHLEAIAPMVDRLLWLLGLLTCHMVLTNCGVSAVPSIERVTLFEEGRDGFTLYRIPGIVVTSGGSVLAYCEAQKFSTADRGEIEIHLLRSTDGGRTWSPPQQVAHLGERLPRNPHLPPGKQAKDFGGSRGAALQSPQPDHPPQPRWRDHLAGQAGAGTGPQCVQRPGGPAGWSSSLLL